MQIIRWKRFATLRPEVYSPDTDKTEARATAIGRATDQKTSLCEPHPGSLLPGESARIDEKDPLSFHYRTYKKSVTARFLELLRFFLQESPLNLPAPYSTAGISATDTDNDGSQGNIKPITPISAPS